MVGKQIRMETPNGKKLIAYDQHSDLQLANPGEEWDITAKVKKHYPRDDADILHQQGHEGLSRKSHSFRLARPTSRTNDNNNRTKIGT